MKNLFYLLLLSTFLLANCKKKETPVAKNPEEAILGEWTYVQFISMGDPQHKLVFESNGLYRSFFKFRSDSVWKLSKDSLHYSISRTTISLEDANASFNPHKLTKLNAKEFRYEVDKNDGTLNSYTYRKL